MKLAAFVTTIGRPITLECLSRLRKFTPVPMEVTVWYDTCGKGVDTKLWDGILKHTDDTILLTKNHGVTEALNWAVLGLDYDYLLLLGDDCLVTEDYWSHLWTPFESMTKVASVGQAGRDFDGNYSINNPDIFPDYIHLWNREAVEDIGALCPAFRIYGNNTTEWHYRARARGWNYVVSKNICHLEKHDSSSIQSHPQFKEIVSNSINQMDAAVAKEFRGYPWWTSDIRREVTHGAYA